MYLSIVKPRKPRKLLILAEYGYFKLKNTIRSFGLWAFTPFIPLCPKPKTENLILLYFIKKKTRRKRIIRMRKNYIA
jgi:hypothetical protein|tara:strand:- start:157 stop:387 length:231 start_codon:yes stop_codon:yes gene_type:complete